MKLFTLLIITFIGVIITLNKSYSQAPVLGNSSTFSVFTGAGAFSSNGSTYLTGDAGTNVGTFTGFPPGIIIGQIYVEDAVTAQVSIDISSAYSQLFSLGCDSVIGITLGNGQILKPYNYCIGAISVLNGNLTLDGQGNPDAIFIFKIDGAFSTAVNSKVILINSASFCNVFWQINGQFTLCDSSVFIGTLIASGEINILQGSSVTGRMFSTAGAVALNSNSISNGMPVASIITADGPISFFTGDSVILSGNSGGTWCNTEISTSITIKTSGDYYVTNTDCCDSINSNHIIVSVMLPVKLLFFIAEPEGPAVNLSWSTASEINNNYFTVMSSSDGIIFNEFAQVNSAGNSNTILNYSLTDHNPLTGTSYYILKQTDFDGRSILSDIVTVYMIGLFVIKVYPNPFTRSVSILFSDAPQEFSFELILYNIQGIIILNRLITEANTTIYTSYLPSGMYSYKILNKNKVLQSGRLTSLQ